jgi:transposase
MMSIPSSEPTHPGQFKSKMKRGDQLPLTVNLSPDSRISKCGDTLARTLLYEAAVVILTRVKRASRLKDWAQAIAKRSGPGKARVALARRP